MNDNILLSNDEELMVLLRKTFLDEAASFLIDSEAALISLDDPARRPSALDQIFRVYHSIKGSSASVGYHDIAKFSHVAEDFLSLLRAHPERVTVDIVSMLLRVNDTLKASTEGMFDDKGWQNPELQHELEAAIASFHREKNGSVEAFGFFDDAATEEKPHPPSEAQGGGGDKKAPAAMAFKIESSKVDSVMDMVGELVVIKSQLIETLSRYQEVDVRAVLGLLDKSVRELHEKTLAMRMQSLKNCFLKIQRMARDLSQTLDRPIDFKMTGDDTELDRALIEQVSDPLLHLCRNAIDHGIESKAQRAAAGKPVLGSISLKAFRRGEGVVIELRDDGGGIHRDKVIEKAISRGLLPADVRRESLPDAQVFDLLFHPGFSTAAAITDISGRGVGLDVVKSNITAMRGRIEIESIEGQGSCFRLLIPLTAAITDGIVIGFGERRYILPLESVRTFVEARTAHLIPLHEGMEAVGVGERHYPIIDLPGLQAETRSGGLYVLLEVMDRTFALPVDSVHGKTQVVLKPLKRSIDEVGFFAGAAVMGNGKVVLVLDVLGLAAVSANSTRMRSAA